MSAAAVIALALKTSVALAVLGLGLRAGPRGARNMLCNPARLIRALVSMYVFMPLFAATLALAFDLHPAVKIVLVVLAVTPVPPLLTKKAMKAGGEASEVIGLLVAVAVCSIVLTPLAVELVGHVFGVRARTSPVAIAQIVFVTVLGPVATGLLVARLLPAVAERAARPVAVAGAVLLAASALPVLVTAWPAIVSLIGNGTIVAIAVFVLVGLVVGYLLGGSDPEDRTVHALFTASRHPGIALAIASANFPAQTLVPGAILLYLIVSAVIVVPYVAWNRRRN